MADAILAAYQGRMMTIPELSAETGVRDYWFYKYLKKGYSPEEIIDLARTPRGQKWEYRGKWLTIRQIAAMSGISPSTVAYRLRTGWTAEEAVDTPLGARPGGGPPPKQELPPAPDGPEGMLWKAAFDICRTIAYTPAAFNFRCVQPMREYAFEGDLLGYRIRFLSPERARLTAYWRENDVPSDLDRVFDVDGETIKEVYQE